MAEGQDDGQEKTEDPTQKRKDDARKDGEVLTSREAFVFTTLAGGGALLYLIAYSMDRLLGYWSSSFVLPRATDLSPLLLLRLEQMGVWLVTLTLALGLPLIVVILATQAMIGGISFSPKGFGFKLSRLNPLSGIGRMVSMNALVELCKAVLKTSLVMTVALLTLLPLLGALGRTAQMAPGQAMTVMAQSIAKVSVTVLLALFFIAGLDLAWQVISHQKKLRMSHQEIKDENKEAEGSPELKGAIRRRQIEASRRARQVKALDDVSTATAIVTNPTHFAVALRYLPETGDAPVVVAMGTGAMAHRVTERADAARIPRIEAPPLARALYYTTDIGSDIPVELYNAVAILLAHVWRIEQGLAGTMPDIDLPLSMRFDAYGRPEKGDPE